MSFLAWIILGVIAGFVGSKLVNRRGEGLVLDLLLGIVGAIVGGPIAPPSSASLSVCTASLKRAENQSSLE